MFLHPPILLLALIFLVPRYLEMVGSLRLYIFHGFALAPLLPQSREGWLFGWLGVAQLNTKNNSTRVKKEDYVCASSVPEVDSRAWSGVI